MSKNKIYNRRTIGMEEIIKEISKIEFDLFVVNSHAIAIQQNDGRYITNI